MKITFFIGNGFDLNLGLKTSYQDFLSWYINEGFFFLRPNTTRREKVLNEVLLVKDRIEKFRKELGSQRTDDVDNRFQKGVLSSLAFKEMWSDLEYAWGEASSHPFFSDPKTYLDVKYDIDANLQCYLQAQNDRITISENETSRFSEGLTSFWKDCKVVEKDKIFAVLSKSNTLEYNFVSFNYTNIVKKLFDRLIEMPPFTANNCLVRPRKGVFCFVHGSIGNNVKLGVDQVEQIINKDFQTNEEVGANSVKTVMHEVEGSKCKERVQDLINTSSILCVFGMSLGLTDQTWWKFVSKHLQDNQQAILILFMHEESYGNETPYVMLPYVNECIDRFFRISGVDKDVSKERIRKQIIVVYNSNMFDQEKLQLKEVEQIVVPEILKKRLITEISPT